MSSPRETEWLLSDGHCRGQAVRAVRSRPRGDDVTGSPGGQWSPEGAAGVGGGGLFGMVGSVNTRVSVLLLTATEHSAGHTEALFDGVKQCPVTRP